MENEKQHLNEKNVKPENIYNNVSDLWLVMKNKFPSLWVERMGSSSYDHNGNLTTQAQSWASELALLTPEMIKVGLRDLSHLPNPSFPPSAIEFVKHCRNRFFYTVQDEIMEYLSNPVSNYEWSSLVAYNVYHNLRVGPFEHHDQIRSRIEKVYNGLSWHDLKPIPDYSIKALPERDYHPINDEPGYRQFCGRIAGLISANTKPGDDFWKKWNQRINKIMPDLTREWWPEFRDSELSVGDFLREKGLNLPREPKTDDPVRESHQQSFCESNPMTEIKTYTFSQLGASMAASKRPDEKVVKLKDHIKAKEAKDKTIEKQETILSNYKERLDIAIIDFKRCKEMNKSLSKQAEDIYFSQADRDELIKSKETIEAQAGEIEQEKTYSSGLEGIIREQKKEIERLKDEIYKYKADPSCTTCNWTCKKCGQFVDPANVTFEETHQGCGGVCS